MRQRRQQNNKSPLKWILFILGIVFFGPLLVSIGMTVFLALISIVLGMLVLALVLLSSPIIFMVFPGVVGIALPAAALFFFGIAMLAIFIAVTAVVIQILRRFLILILDLIKRIIH